MSTDTALCILDAIYNASDEEGYDTLQERMGFGEFRYRIAELAKTVDVAYALCDLENPGLCFDFEIIDAIVDYPWDWSEENPFSASPEKILAIIRETIWFAQADMEARAGYGVTLDDLALDTYQPEEDPVTLVNLIADKYGLAPIRKGGWL